MNFGIVGTGAMAHTMMRAFRASPDARAVGVASRSEDRALEFAGVYGLKHHFGTIASLADNSEVDVVYVASHPADHVSDCLAALQAGKPVLCEKPLATSVADAERLAAVALRQGVFLMEGMWIRFLPAIRRAEELTKAHVVGPPRVLQADFGYPVPSGEAPSVGVLLDRAIYPISLAILLLGVPEATSSVVVRDDEGVACQASFILRHHQGALSQLAVSTQAFLGNRALISCTEGKIELAEPLLGTERIRIQKHAPLIAQAQSEASFSTKQRVLEMLKSSSLLRRLRSGYFSNASVERRSYGMNPYAPQLREVVECVRAGKTESDWMPIQHTLEALRIVEQAGSTEKVRSDGRRS